jgi:hypothetical protein
VQPRTVELADPQVYQQFFYDGPMPQTCRANLVFTAGRPGWLNAIRVITKNILAAHLLPPSTVDWLMNYLVIPLSKPIYIHEGDRIRVTFDYRPGDEVHVLTAGVEGTLVDRP